MKKIISMFLIVILVVSATSITFGASDDRYKFLYISRDMEWTSKGILKGDIYRVSWERTQSRTFTYYLYDDSFVLLKDQKTIGQIVEKKYNRRGDLYRIDVVTKTGQRINNLEYEDVQGRLEKEYINDNTSPLKKIFTVNHTKFRSIGLDRGDMVTSRSVSYIYKIENLGILQHRNSYDFYYLYNSNKGDYYNFQTGEKLKNSVDEDDVRYKGEAYKISPVNSATINNLVNQGWEVVHEYAALDGASLGNHNYENVYVEYIPNVISVWKRVNGDEAFNRGVLNISKVEGSNTDSNKVHYGNYGSYNPKLYEHMVVLNDNPEYYNLVVKNANNIGVSEDIEGWTFSDATAVNISESTIHIPTGQAFRLQKKGTDSIVTAHVLRRYSPIPAQVESVSVAESGVNGVVATGRVKNIGMPSVEEYGHLLSTSSNLTYNNYQKINKYGYLYTPTNFNSIFTGLSEGVTYYIRPYAITEIGTYYGAVQSFKLNRPPALSFTKPSPGQVIHIGDTTNFSGTAYDPDGDNLTYSLKIGTSSGGTNLYNGIPNGIKTNTKFTHSQNIRPSLIWNSSNNRYERRIYATATVNDGKKSDNDSTNFYIVNYKPNIEITTSPITHNYALYEPFSIQGKVWDVHRDNITVSATINGKTVSTTISNPPSSKPASNNFTLTWNGSNSPEEGEYTNIKFNISDAYNGTNSKVWTGTIVVEDILKKIEDQIDQHINLDSDKDVRTLVINTNTKVSASTRNDEILERIRKKLINRNLNLYFIGKDQATINYIKSRLH